MTKASDLLPGLLEELTACRDRDSLNQLASSEDFRKRANSLDAESLSTLREHYETLRTTLSNRRKLEQLDGKIVIISNYPTFGHGENGQFAIFRGKLEDTGEDIECLTSAVRVLRWMINAANKPKDYWPQRVRFTKDSHMDGKKIWNITVVPAPQTTARTPF